MKKKLFLSLLVTSLSLSALTVSAAESSSEPDSLTFEALSRYTFEFSSGAGAWSTYFTIEKDGSFAGNSLRHLPGVIAVIIPEPRDRYCLDGALSSL